MKEATRKEEVWATKLDQSYTPSAVTLAHFQGGVACPWVPSPFCLVYVCVHMYEGVHGTRHTCGCGTDREHIMPI